MDIRFPLSNGIAENCKIIPIIERNRALIPGPKGNNGNREAEYFPLQSSTLGDGDRRGSLKNKNIFFSVAGIKIKSLDFT